MKLKKLFLMTSIIFAIALFCGISVSAATEVASGTCNTSISWTLDSNGLLIISGSGNMPKYEDDSPPYSSYNTQIKSVKIEDGITSVSYGAFYRFSQIESVILPSTLQYVNDVAFSECTSLKNIIIPEGTYSIGDSAFYKCTSLESIIIPDSVYSIGENAFCYCSNLSNIQLSNNLSGIGYNAFAGGVPYSGIEYENNLKYIDNYLIERVGGSTDYTIREGTKLIAGGTFWVAASIKSVTIPKSMKSINNYAFFDCTGLTDVYYESDLTDWNKVRVGSYNNSGIWNAKKHYLVKYSFNSNGGTSVAEKKTYDGISEVITTKTGFTLAGWYDNEELNGEAVIFPYASDYNTTLYAKWVCKVTYTGDINTSVNVELGENVTLPTAPSGYKYIFTANGEPWDGMNITENVTVTVEKVLSDECDILSIISPDGGTITDKTINFKVASNMSEVTPEFELSAGADWDLYSAATATKPLPSKTVIIPRGGITITYYVKVIAADNETVNTYTVNFYRNTKSISPVITASRDKVTITAANCDIYYTTDGSTPTIESKKYIEVFSAPSKATIKAIAVENGKDEISDVVTFEVPEYLTTTMTGLNCYDMLDGTCYYSIMIQSDGVPTGEFIVAIYDIDGRLIGIKTEPKTIDKEETITDIVEVSGTPHIYKAFFWNSLEDLVPLCNNAEGTVIK